jgi:hypothetical protein
MPTSTLNAILTVLLSTAPCLLLKVMQLFRFFSLKRIAESQRSSVSLPVSIVLAARMGIWEASWRPCPGRRPKKIP